MTEQIQEIPENPVQSEIVPEVRSQRNPFKLVLLVVLGLIVLVGAVYAGVTIGKKQSSPEVIPQVIETSPTPTSGETANWKTYTSKYGYSIKYPENLFNKDLGAGNSYLDNVVFASKSLDKSELGDLYQKDYGNYFVVSVANEPNIEKRLKLIVQERKEVQVDGLLGVKLNNNIVFVTRNNRTYVFDNSVYGKSINSIIIDQILSTFEFLDSTSTDETANWKTYRDSVASFEIKYPANWSYTIKSKTTTSSSPDQPNKPTYSGSLSFIGPEGQIDLVFGDGFGGAPCREAIGPSAQLIGVKIGNYTVHLCNYSQGGRTYYASPFGDAGGPTVANASYNFTFSYLESSAQSKDLILKILSTFKFLD